VQFAIKNEKKVLLKEVVYTNGKTEIIVDVSTANEACSILSVESFRKHSE